MTNSFFSKLFYLIAVLDLIDKDLGRLKAGNIVLVDNNGCVAGDIASDFLLSLLVDKATKSADVDILAAGH